MVGYGWHFLRLRVYEIFRLIVPGYHHPHRFVQVARQPGGQQSEPEIAHQGGQPYFAPYAKLPPESPQVYRVRSIGRVSQAHLSTVKGY